MTGRNCRRTSGAVPMREVSVPIMFHGDEFGQIFGDRAPTWANGNRPRPKPRYGVNVSQSRLRAARRMGRNYHGG